nr:hypothetical protein [Tanacetum cinerariifolium]
LRLSKEARIQEEEEADELYRDVNINQGRGLQVTQMLKTLMRCTNTTNNNSKHILENLPTFNSAFRFDERLRSLETSFSEYRQSNPFVDVMSAIPGIVQQYMTQQMTEAVREAVQIQTDRIQDSLQRENDEFLRNIDENMKKIIKGQVKNQVKEQVSPDLSKMEIKKILIEKMEGNKSIHRSDEQQNLYKALVEAYDVDKAILDTYGESTILKRRQEDDDQEGPSAGSDRGSKRQKEGGERASASTPSETETDGACRSTTGWRNPHIRCLRQTKTLPAAQGDAQSWISDLASQTDARSSFNELLDTPIDFSNFIMNRLNIDTLTPELLDGPTYELMRGSCNSLTELEYHLEEVYKATTDQLDWVNPEGQQYPHNLLQPLPLIPDNRGRRESALDVYSKRRIIAVTELKIVEWHD